MGPKNTLMDARVLWSGIMQQFSRMTQLGLLFFGTASLLGCDEPHIKAAKQVCACFDVAGYKMQKGHQEGGQGFERCKEQMDKALAKLNEAPAARAAFLAELETCPAASTRRAK